MMLPEIHKIKGTPPAVIIFYELKKTNCSLEQFMKETGIVVSEGMFDEITPELSAILGDRFGVDATYFLEVQEKFKKAQKENKEAQAANIPKINRFIFWDTDFDKLDWKRYKKSIIKRIFERGFQDDKKAIISYYGKSVVVETLKELKQKIEDETDQALYQYSIPITFGKFLQNK